MVAGAPIKRPAGSAARGSAPKKARVADGTPSKLKSIEKALKIAQKKDVPAEVISLVGITLSKSLPTYKDERHEFQSEVVDMADKVLADSLSALEEDVSKAQELVDGGDGEKDRREKAVAEAEAAHTASLEDTKAKEEDRKAKAEAYEATVAPLKAAKDAQKSGDAEGVILEKEKEALQEAIQSDLNPMKESGGKQRQLARLSKAIARAGLEDSLVESVHLPLCKAPDQRGSFDGVVLKCLEEAIEEKMAKLSSDIEAFGPAKEERAAKVKEAQEAHDAAKEASESAINALAEARKAEATAKEAAATAKKSAKSLGSDLANAAQCLDESKAELSNFQNGPLAAFIELKNRTVPQPEPQVSAEAPQPEPQESAEAPAAVQD
jgi:chromosome segregation ATPase